MVFSTLCKKFHKEKKLRSEYWVSSKVNLEQACFVPRRDSSTLKTDVSLRGTKQAYSASTIKNYATLYLAQVEIILRLYVLTYDEKNKPKMLRIE